MRQQYKGFTLVELLVVIAIIGTLLALLKPFHAHPARERARQATCRHNLELIAKAIRSYESNYGTLPPAYTVDDKGNRLHSWRTLVLPYLGEQALYSKIDLARPWDDSANVEARNTKVESYQCPSSPNSPEEKGFTTYLGLVGERCVFANEESCKLAEITRDLSTTVCVVDVQDAFAVHWMSPNDINLEATLQMFQDANTKHPALYYVAYLDGNAGLIPSEVDAKELHKKLTVTGE